VAKSRGFTLAELIESTANELRALREKDIKDPVMRFTSCDLELSVTVRPRRAAAFAFGWWTHPARSQVRP
jgi:hypothetical protein